MLEKLKNTLSSYRNDPPAWLLVLAVIVLFGLIAFAMASKPITTTNFVR